MLFGQAAYTVGVTYATAKRWYDRWADRTFSNRSGLSFAKTDHAKNQWFREGEMLPFEMVGGGTDTS